MKVDQSVLERQPKTEADAVLQVRAPTESERPLPVRSLNDSPLTMRLVVEAVLNDEYRVEDEYADVITPPTERPAAIVELSVVEVALKLPKVGVEVAVMMPEEFVERSELTATDESVREPEIVELAVEKKPFRRPMIVEVEL